MFEFILRFAAPKPCRQVTSSHPKTTALAVARAGGVLVMLLLTVLASHASAAKPRRHRPHGTSDRQTRKEAIGEIPFDRLEPDGKRKASDVLNHLTLYRRLPVQAIRCDPELYTYVVNHPEILANIWQLLGVEDIVLEPVTSEVYRATDGGETEGHVEFLYRNHDTHIILAHGSYDGPLFVQPVRGVCLLVLKTGFRREPSGDYYVTTRLDVFLSLEHAGAEFLARTFHPFVVKMADNNFLATGSFMASLSDAAESHPEAVLRVAQRLDHVRPEVRRRFVGITTEVSRRAQERSILQAGGIGAFRPLPLRR